MNLRSLSAFPPTLSRTVYTTVAPNDMPAPGARPQLRIVRDHVVISDRAQALLEKIRSAPEFDVSIAWPPGLDSLGEARVSQVRDRIRDGYYSQPEILREIAELLGESLVTET